MVSGNCNKGMLRSCTNICLLASTKLIRINIIIHVKTMTVITPRVGLDVGLGAALRRADITDNPCCTINTPPLRIKALRFSMTNLDIISMDRIRYTRKEKQHLQRGNKQPKYCVQCWALNVLFFFLFLRFRICLDPRFFGHAWSRMTFGVFPNPAFWIFDPMVPNRKICLIPIDSPYFRECYGIRLGRSALRMPVFPYKDRIGVPPGIARHSYDTLRIPTLKMDESHNIGFL